MYIYIIYIYVVGVRGKCIRKGEGRKETSEGGREKRVVRWGRDRKEGRRNGNEDREWERRKGDF